MLLQLWLCGCSCGYVVAAVVMFLQLWLCCCSCDFVVAAVVMWLQLWLYCCSCGYVVAAVVMLLQLWLCGCNCGYVVAAVERRGARAVPGRVRSQHPVVAHGRVVHRSAGPRSQVSRATNARSGAVNLAYDSFTLYMYITAV